MMKILLLHSFQDYLILAYSFLGIISIVGYGPQIWTLVKSTGRSMSTPISTWSLWTIESFVAFLYAIFILKDALAMVIVGIDFFAAIIICVLTVYNRYYRFSDKKLSSTIQIHPRAQG